MADTRTASQGWDWKDQIDLKKLANQLNELTQDLPGGPLRIHIMDTGSDDIGYVLARRELTEDELDEAYYGPAENLDADAP